MSGDDGDRDDEERWCAARREDVAAYLRARGLVHGRIGDWPAWHVEPLVSVWAVESAASPGWVGWWAVAGDLPTDYVTVGTVRHPRQGLRDLCARWNELADCMRRGVPHPTVRFGDPSSWPTLAPLLESRAQLLRAWADDDSLWEE